MNQSEELEDGVRALIYKLKEIFFNRKNKPVKGKKASAMNAAPKKRYIVGLSEIKKGLRMGELCMLIVATNLEHVEGTHGLDEFLLEMHQLCKSKAVPLVYCFNRAQLGFLAKFKG